MLLAVMIVVISLTPLGWLAVTGRLHGGITLRMGLVMLLILPAFTLACWARAQLKDAVDSNACSRCGYDMRGQRAPRCPECGALTGFQKSADDLGLDQGELKL